MQTLFHYTNQLKMPRYFTNKLSHKKKNTTDNDDATVVEHEVQ